MRFVGTHFGIFVRKFVVHLRTAYTSPQKLAQPLIPVDLVEKFIENFSVWYRWIMHESCCIYLAFAEGGRSLKMQRFFYFFFMRGRDGDCLILFT